MTIINIQNYRRYQTLRSQQGVTEHPSLLVAVDGVLRKGYLMPSGEIILVEDLTPEHLFVSLSEGGSNND